MKLDFLGVNNQKNLIDGVILFPLKINRDPRGSLMETFKISWPEIFNDNLPFAQSYCSITNPGFARDERQWHFHPTKQTDRFVVIKGNAVFALYDQRKNSKTFGRLNLFLMAEKKEPYLLVIPREVLHGFCVVGRETCYLISYISTLYDPKEEGRISFKDFSWNPIRACFKS